MLFLKKYEFINRFGILIKSAELLLTNVRFVTFINSSRSFLVDIGNSKSFSYGFLWFSSRFVYRVYRVCEIKTTTISYTPSNKQDLKKEIEQNATGNFTRSAGLFFEKI